MEPRVLKRERRLHLSYDVSHRIHCSSIYSVPAPNGSTLVLYGYDNGLRILWKGGRRLRHSPATHSTHHTNGISNSHDVIVIDDEEEEEEEEEEAQQSQLSEAYEVKEDQQDPDCPLPSIVQAVEVDMGTAVLRMAIPTHLTLTTTTQSIQLARTHAIVVLACASGNIVLLTIPLAPPTESSIPEYVSKGIRELLLTTDDSLANALSIRLIPNDDSHSSSSRVRRNSDANKNVQGRVLVAADTKHLQLWTIGLTSTSMSAAKSLASPILRTPSPGSRLSFHPGSRSSELLFADRSGAARIYDPFAAESGVARPAPSTPELPGKWIMSYLTPFQDQPHPASLARRKAILAAEWVLGGRGVLVLLEDGEWGIWNLSVQAQPGKAVEDFAISGYLVSTTTAESGRDANRQKKSASNLAPMTPNTRKSRAENLFSGPTRATGVASTGGISVSQSNGRTSSIDESVIMWYNGAIYSIPSLQTFWQRSNNKTGGLGSLYAPAVAHISDIDLMNENITSVSQFPASSAPASSTLGQMNVPRDLLVSAEHRFLIIQSLRSGLQGATTVFQQPVAGRPAKGDQRMLDAGELDLLGMDRILDDMAGDAATRRVGFAA